MTPLAVLSIVIRTGVCGGVPTKIDTRRKWAGLSTKTKFYLNKILNLSSYVFGICIFQPFMVVLSKDMHRTKEEGRVHDKGNAIKKNLNSFFSSTITFK